MSSQDLWQQAKAEENAGQIGLAAQTVQLLLAQDPGSVDAALWLAWLRRSMGDRQAAWHIGQSLLKAESPSLPPAPSVRARVRHLLGVLMLDDGNLSGADEAFDAAINLAPTFLAAVCSRAELQRRMGNLNEAMRLIDQALRPESLPQNPNQQQIVSLAVLLAQVLVELQDGRDDEAQEICEVLIDNPHTLEQGLALTVWLVQAGLPGAGQLLAGIESIADKAALSTVLSRVLEDCVHTQGYWALQNLSKAATHWLPDDSCFQCASLYASALADDAEPQALLRQATVWFAQLHAEQVAKGFKPHPQPDHLPGTTMPRKPRLAYFVRFPTHVPLLDAVIAAHDPGAVELHVFASEAWPGLPAHVQLHGVDASRLGEICCAVGMDILIETGGLQHYSGQGAVMQALATRVAPVQVGWVGTLMSSGGLFDVLLADDVSVAPGEEAHYSERIERLKGGQWCWSPPQLAPPVAPAPCMANGHVTLGVVGRSLRHGPAFLNSLARVMAQDTKLEVRFVGQVWGDALQRRAVDSALSAMGVAIERLHFDPSTSREGFWHWLQGVDLVLDTCPASGGLSLLDTLWMGVPVLTHPGRVLGSRQAASILSSLGLSQWIAKDADDLVRLTLATAGNCAELQNNRMTMRERFRQSPLLNGSRVARQIEALAKDRCQPS